MAAKTDNQKKLISVEHMEDMMPFIREALDNGQSVTFSPHGTSMLPMIRQGIDTVTISPITEKLKKYDIPLYQRKSGKYVLHRIVKVGKTYTCIGDNQYALESGLLPEQMIGVVTSFTRNKRPHTAKEASYKLYCILWHNTRLLRRVCRALMRRINKLIQKK